MLFEPLRLQRYNKSLTYANLYAILVNFLGYVYPIWICLPILPSEAEGDADAVLEENYSFSGAPNTN